ncbi:hypothetical protein [Alloactinosynnema sp. L-07]|uniref:hypothetical protein n=1 Tax=Alloactinosynnema sp. L-07 TaxID=1653480 RepID=UPI00065EF3ED|nr:hypothetical protein [Alloactinosynnema sp. L-07]CRK55462.1 hypothetical protein [Alloactinosynnema sp. L-07]
MGDIEPTHVDLLISKYANGRSIAEIERENGLTAGALGHHLKPSQRGGAPKFEVLMRFVAALDAPLREVSSAFFADAGAAMDGGEPLPPRAVRLTEQYLGLDPTRRRIADRMIQALVDDQTAETR